MSLNKLYALLAFAAVVLLVKCASKPEAGLNRQWMLVSFDEYDKEFLTRMKAQLDLSGLSAENKTYPAFMGCNNMMVQLSLDSNKIKVGDISTTMQYCDDNQSLEKKFISALPQMSEYRVEGHFLYLKSNQGREMKFIAADWD